MDIVVNYIEGITNNNPVIANGYVKRLKELSINTNKVYRYIHLLEDLLNNNDFCVKNRALYIINLNLKWDNENKIEEILERNKNIYCL